MICWYRFRKYNPVCVIVEDQPSALRVAATGQADAVALMGTLLNHERAIEILQQNYKRVWLSLDRDAMAKAVKYLSEFSSYIPNLRMKALDNVDIKDMTPEAFVVFMKEITEA